MTRVAFNHLVSGLEASVGDLPNGQLLMVSLLSRDDRGISNQWEVNAGVWDQVSLEFSQINIEGTVETEGSRNRRDDLADKTVQVRVSRTLNIEVTAAD